MASLARLSVDFVAKTAGFSAGVNKAEKEIKGFAGVVNRFSPSLGQLTQKLTSVGTAAKGIFTSGMIAASGAMAAAGIAVKLMVDRLRDLDDQIDAAAQVGVAAGEMQRLGYAFKRMGSDVEAAQDAVSFMTKNIGKAANGSASAEKAFARLGLTGKQLASMEPVDALSLISDRLSLLPTKSQRAAAATEIFGKSAIGSAEALTSGSAALKHFGDEAERLGLVLTDLEAEQIGKTNDALDKLGAAAEGNLNKLATSFGPAIEAVTGFTTELLVAERRLSPLESLAATFGTTFTEAFLIAEVGVKNLGRTWELVITKIALDMESINADIQHRLKPQNSVGVLRGFVGRERERTELEKSLTKRAAELGKEFVADMKAIRLERAGGLDFGKAPGELPKVEIKNPTLEFTPDSVFGASAGGSFADPMKRTAIDFADVISSLSDDIAKDIKIATPGPPEAAIRGSVAAMSAITRAQQTPQQKSLNDIAGTLKKMLEVEREFLAAMEGADSLELVLP